MKVLLGHNFYRSSAPSGEDAVYRNEKALLQNHAEVISFERHNDDINETGITRKINLALQGAWSGPSYQAISKLIQQSRPDIAHFHNTFPQLSPSVWKACQDQGVPVVQTLHNFRMVCPGALLMRQGKPCEDCLGSAEGLLPALRHRCYRDSLAATGAQVYTISSNRLRGSYQHQVDRYIALTRFAASRVIKGGLPEARIVIKPNFLPETPTAGQGSGDFAFFAGRLTPEKGVRTLLEAWSQPDLKNVPLKIAGDGAERQTLETLARQRQLNVEFLGYRTSAEVLNLVSQAKFQIVPSEWYEGFPMVLLEAFAVGTPVLASAIGSLDELVTEHHTGLKFTAGDAQSLAKQAQVLLNYDNYPKLRQTTRQHFEQNFTAETNIKQLLSIYESVINSKRR